MHKNFPVHLFGQICWLPTESGKRRFPPGTVFRAFAKFTSDFKPSFNILVNYAPVSNDDQEYYRVKLSFPSWEPEEIRKLSRNSEIIIMDGYKVLALCRNFSSNNDPINKMEDDWD